MRPTTDDLSVSHLRGRARRAAEAIVQLLTARLAGLRTPTGGGCRAFYSRAEWEGRNERSGSGAVLVVCHDGGDIADYYGYYSRAHEAQEELREVLSKMGLYVEVLNCWSFALYRAE